MDASEYEIMEEKIELLMDVQTSLNQISSGKGIAQRDAKNKVLKRVHK
jgi:AAA+ superfamily predicted ATPase